MPRQLKTQGHARYHPPWLTTTVVTIDWTFVDENLWCEISVGSPKSGDRGPWSLTVHRLRTFTIDSLHRAIEAVINTHLYNRMEPLLITDHQKLLASIDAQAYETVEIA